jgi:penicillin amidase
MKTPMFTLLAALVALLVLTGGECSFSASSGSSSGGSGHKPPPDSTGSIGVVIEEGRFVDAPVEGLGYASGNQSGTTGARGEFRYEPGTAVRFFIGDILLGTVPAGKTVVTPLDLVAGSTLDTPAVVNIARLLLSLDAVPGDESITLPPAVTKAAVTTNETLAGTLGYLDFADEAAFINAASQLVASLTTGYPFTAVLVDADTARRHLADSLADLDLPE